MNANKRRLSPQGNGTDGSIKAVETLSAGEKHLYLEFVQASQQVTTREDFQEYSRQYIRPLFPHGMTLACVGAIVNGNAVLEMAVAVDYPSELLKKVHEVTSVGDRALLARWYVERKPQLVELEVNDELLSAMERAELLAFNFNNFAAHGVIDLDGKKGSYISFARIPGRLDAHHAFLLELMVPHIHQVLLSILRQSQSVAPATAATLLTPKEMVVLRWLATGKTNPEIAALLNRSVSTIRNQVHSILGKIGACGRAEALRKAHEFRLL